MKKVIFLNKYTAGVWNDDLFLRLGTIDIVRELLEIGKTLKS